MEFKAAPARRQGSVLIYVVVAAVLQVALAPHISLFGGSVNFMLVTTVALAVSGDPRTMAYIGFFSGLFFDLTSSVPVGLMALLLTLVGYGIAAVSRGIAPGINMEALRMAGIALVLVNLVYGIALFALGAETSLLYALGVHGLASSALDVLACTAALAVAPSADQGRGFAPSHAPSRRNLGHINRAHARGTRFKGMR